MSKFQKIYHFMLCTLAVLLLIAVIFSIIPRFWGISPYIVQSGSMEPAIATGSMAYIDQSDDPGKIHTGDIITYELSGTRITHRVVDETLTTVITKGDANENTDFAPVSRSSILGKYLFSIPYLGYIYSYISNPYLLLVLISLFGVDLIISLINQLLISKKEEQT